MRARARATICLMRRRWAPKNINEHDLFGRFFCLTLGVMNAARPLATGRLHRSAVGAFRYIDVAEALDNPQEAPIVVKNRAKFDEALAGAFRNIGRVGRLLMNTMMASGGYAWTIIPVAQRAPYMAALESASVDQDIRPFAQFLSGLVNI